MRASDLPHARVGLIVPRFGHSAVERNRVKRRLRESVRLELLPGAPAVDVVIHTSKAAYSLPFGDLKAEVERVADALKRFGA
jgi:ribonuclease P protein component